jgi:phosphomannomutase
LRKSIKFGSDGWRGVIAGDFNSTTLACICDALFVKLNASNPVDAPTILIGYDCRFMADIFAHNFARLWTSLGGVAIVASSVITSPALAWYTRAKGAALGVMLTASHNPPHYLGIKLKDNFGGSASPEFQKEISVLATDSTIFKRVHDGNLASALDFDPMYRHSLSFDVFERYPERAITEFAELGPDFKGRYLPKVFVDFMHGAAFELASRVFSAIGIDFESIRGNRDPTFGGNGPEPVPDRLTELRERVANSNGIAIGIAFDGDGDRLVAVDETGGVLLSSELFTIHMRHLALERGERGRAVGTVSFSNIVDRAARDLSLELVKVPVGFKSIAAEFRKGGTLIGGEESGGTGFKFWLPERDAIVMALVLLEAIAACGGKLITMRDELYKLYGMLYFKSDNVPLVRSMNYDELDKAIGCNHTSFLGKSVQSTDTTDGRKFVFVDGSWILIRLSGTEPLVRLYAESELESDAFELLDTAEVFIKRLISH